MSIVIQEVSAQGCSKCEQAKEILDQIAEAYPALTIEFIDMTSPEGQELVGKHGIMSSPGILINGELFSMGGLDKGKLEEKIASLQTKE